MSEYSGHEEEVDKVDWDEKDYSRIKAPGSRYNDELGILRAQIAALLNENADLREENRNFQYAVGLMTNDQANVKEMAELKVAAAQREKAAKDKHHRELLSVKDEVIAQLKEKVEKQGEHISALKRTYKRQ